jgi:O-antigen ligase
VIIAVLMKKHDTTIFRSPSWFIILFAVLVAGLLFTTKRGDWIATTAAVLIYGLVFNKRFALAFVAVAACVVLAVTPFRERLFTLARPMDNSSDRVVLWQNALSHADKHPILGFGPQTFDSVFTARAETSDKGIGGWHNDWIQLYIESGALGIITFCLLLGSIAYCSLVLIRTPHHEGLLIGWMGILMLVSYIIIGLFGSPTTSITNIMLFRFFLALLSVQHLTRLRPQ